MSRQERIVLAIAPTIVILLVYGLIEALSHQRLLFTSLAASAFLVYFRPTIQRFRIKALFVAQLLSAGIGTASHFLLGSGYLSAAAAMTVTIFLIVFLDVIHPPAVGTALAFAFKTETINNLFLFVLAVFVITGMVLVQRRVLEFIRERARRRGAGFAPRLDL